MQSMQSEPETRAQDAAAARAFTPRAIFVFSLLVGVLAAFALFAWYRHGLTMDQGEREQRLANRVAASVRGEIEKLTSLALAFQAIYIVSDAVSEIEFANAYSLLSANLDSRARVAIAFAQREYIDGSEHYITRLVAPAEGNEALFGLDVGAQPENLRALLRARWQRSGVVSSIPAGAIPAGPAGPGGGHPPTGIHSGAAPGRCRRAPASTYRQHRSFLSGQPGHRAGARAGGS